MLSFKEFNLIDTPGLNDPDIPITEWANRFNEWNQMLVDRRIKGVDLVLLIFKQSTRPTSQDTKNLAVLKHALSSIGPENLCVVFTFCDEINPNKSEHFDMNYAHDWFNNAISRSKCGDNIGGIPEIPKDRIFFFKGEEGWTPETTSQEFTQFVRKCLRTSKQAADFNHFNLDNYMANNNKIEVGDMKAMLEE